MDVIEARATVRFARTSPQKTRLVADQIRGKNVEEAKRTLQFSPKRSAVILLKALNSAIANAEEKNVEDPEILKVSLVHVDEGAYRHRYLGRARGKVNTLDRKTSHITLVVSEDEKAKAESLARAAARDAKRAKKQAGKKAAEPKAKAAAKAETSKEPKAKKAAATKKAAASGSDATGETDNKEA
jgi:large subunit ribosomal protein L22